jgi:hypothetical protein
VVRGPYSDFSKTLTADSPITPETAGTFGSLLVEPCYWTPSLPFWYDLRLTITLADGTTRAAVIPVGIKRFYCEGRNLLLAGKRIVLRGVAIDMLDDAQLSTARKSETALIVRHVDDEICGTASRLGVPLIVDLRAAPSASSAELEWHPAVMLILVTGEQADSPQPRTIHRVVCGNANTVQAAVSCDAYAIELQPGERPPAWAATCDKPVIVIRKDPGADIRTARAGCDKLQAEFAPEFDLAGYFV